jgi:hypothetical protein
VVAFFVDFLLVQVVERMLEEQERKKEEGLQVSEEVEEMAPVQV